MLTTGCAAANGRHQTALNNATIHSKKRTTNLTFTKTLTLHARKTIRINTYVRSNPSIQ